jgi:hypothetical protein
VKDTSPIVVRTLLAVSGLGGVGGHYTMFVRTHARSNVHTRPSGRCDIKFRVASASSHKLARHTRQTRQRTQAARKVLRRANAARNRLHIEPAQRAASSSPLVAVARAAVIIARVAATGISSSGARSACAACLAHLGQIDAKLASELVQDAAADEGHNDHEKHLVRVSLCVAPDFAQKVLELGV